MRFGAVASCVAICASTVFAEPARNLADARRHFGDLDFELVLSDTDHVANDRAVTTADKAEALFLRGSALVVLDREAEASSAFEALLTLDPYHYVTSETPPRIRAAFESARAAHKIHLEEQLETEHGDQLRAVSLEVTAPVGARGGRPQRWRVRLTDPHQLVSRLVLGYRRETDRDYAMISAPSAATLELGIPGPLLASRRDYRLAWYVEAVHASGARVRELGEEQQPQWLQIAAGQPPQPPAVTSRWWFWAGLVGLAAAAVTIPVVIKRSHDVGPQQIVIGR